MKSLISIGVNVAQLLGISCEEEIEMDFSFKGSAGINDKNPDGWGYAYMANETWFLYKEPFEIDQFAKKDFQLNFPTIIKSDLFLSHIRFASKGRVAMENTHPFEKELYDKKWVFAHMGQVRMYRHILESSEYSSPVGDTDSEEVFCTILGEIRSRGRHAADKEMAREIEKVANELSKQGGINFLLSDGEHLYAYYSGYRSLYHTQLRPPFDTNVLGEDHQLWFTLFAKDQDMMISIVSAEPVIKEANWKELDKNTLYIFKEGKRTKFVI